MAFPILATTLAATLIMPCLLRAEPESATVRVGATEGWGQVPRPWDDPASNLAGDTGDPELIEFSGNKTFTTKEIREQLMMSASYLLGSHHLALREPFLGMLRDKIRAGYQNCGFPDPQVAVRYDKDRRRAKVEIAEGKRYRCGEVLVEGVAPNVARTIIARLTIRPESEGFPGPQGGVSESGKPAFSAEVRPESGSRNEPFSQKSEQTVFWETGEPASFVESIRQELENVVHKALAQHGLFFPKLEVKLQPIQDKSTADLLVRVADTGPAAVIDEILVEGNRRNSKTEIAEYLGLKVGMPITRATLEEAERRLWDSGRFRVYELVPELTPSENPAARHLRLVIRVEEFEATAKLAEEMPPKQSALLLLSRYLSGVPDRSEEFVLVAEGLPGLLPVELCGQVIVAPGKGFLARMADPKGGKSGYAYSVAVSDKYLAVYDLSRGVRLVITNSELSLKAFLRFLPSAPPETNMVNFSVGAGFVGNVRGEKQDGAGMHFEFTVSPAALVEQAKELDGEALLANGQWTIAGSNLLFRINATTGRPEELKWFLADADGHTNRVSVILTNNTFETACLEMEREGESLTNRYSPAHPTTSTVRFLLSEALSIGGGKLMTNLPPARRELIIAGIERLISPEVLDLDQKPATDSAKEIFAIPLDETDLAIAQNSLLALYSGLVFRYCNEWFPKYSWPWTLARESALVLASKGTFAEGELERLSRSEDTGPLGSLVIAYLLGQLNPPAGRTFATRGLTRLSTTDFKADCRLLLQGDSALAKTFERLAVSLGKMPASEVEALAGDLPAPEAGLLRDSARALRQSPSLPLLETLYPALETYWNSRLRAVIRAKLLGLSVKLQNAPPPRTDL